MTTLLLFEWANSVIDQVQAYYFTNPRTLFAIVVFSLFFLYYVHNVVQKPILFCVDGRFRWFIRANCLAINEQYWPTIWCYETHLLTSISTFLRGLLPKLMYHREYVRTPDGGQISLDWYDPEGEEYDENCEETCNSVIHKSHDRPIALFLPGLTGCSQAEYIKTMVPLAHRIGYRAVAINYRGLGNTRLLTPRLYCAANDEDLHTALRHIRASNPEAKLVATGISMGGIILGRYLITTGYESLVDAAFLVSVCFDFLEVVDSMERGLNLPLNQLLTKGLINIVLEHQEWYRNCPQFDIEAIRRCRNIREFDEAFTIRMFNFATPSDYYRESSHKGKLACIKKPTFCINAADDMFAPASSLPVDEVAECSHVAMLVTARGGHIGFMEGLMPKFLKSSSYYSERVLEQYLQAMYDLPDIRRELF